VVPPNAVLDAVARIGLKTIIDVAVALGKAGGDAWEARAQRKTEGTADPRALAQVLQGSERQQVHDRRPASLLSMLPQTRAQADARADGSDAEPRTEPRSPTSSAVPGLRATPGTTPLAGAAPWMLTTMDRLLDQIADGDRSDATREQLLMLFGWIGPDHERVRAGRSRLASILF
jgi:hypothetical protein